MAVSIYTWHKAKYINLEIANAMVNSSLISGLGWFALFITTLQIAIGTSVRETVDAVITTFPSLPRNQWVAQLGQILDYHRDFAILTLIVNVGLYFLILKKYKKTVSILNCLTGVLALIVTQSLVGAMLSYWSLPPIAQASHIFLASLLFGLQFYIVLLIGQRPSIKYTLA